MVEFAAVVDVNSLACFFIRYLVGSVIVLRETKFLVGGCGLVIAPDLYLGPIAGGSILEINSKCRICCTANGIDTIGNGCHRTGVDGRGRLGDGGEEA